MRRISTIEKQQLLAAEICEYLVRNMDRKITIEELVEKYGYSATHIKNCFKMKYGMPIHKYVRSKRIERAARMLLETDEGILEIAGKVGFENGSKFSKVFCDTYGMTPGRYRKTAGR